MDVEAVRSNRRTWDRIAASFDATRRHPWPPVVSYFQGLPRGARLLDAGCGNGRHLSAAKAVGLRPLGLDLSLGLLRAARRHASVPVLAGILERPPLRSRSFDALLVAASMHHVRGRTNRIAAWAGLRALLRPGGSLLATVWVLDQARFRERPPAPPAGRAEPGDATVAWTQQGLAEERFIHLYRASELGEELVAAGWRLEREWAEALGGPEPDNLLARATAEGL